MAKSHESVRIRADVLATVEEVPPGRVTTYGAIAQALDVTARRVASVLASLDADESAELSWHRVVGAGGILRTTTSRREQAARLRAEGLTVTAKDAVADFDTAFWSPG